MSYSNLKIENLGAVTPVDLKVCWFQSLRGPRGTITQHQILAKSSNWLLSYGDLNIDNFDSDPESKFSFPISCFVSK